MKKPDNVACETCVFWYQFDAAVQGPNGKCHRSSPYGGEWWTSTQARDWCGEWRSEWPTEGKP